MRVLMLLFLVCMGSAAVVRAADVSQGEQLQKDRTALVFIEFQD